MEKHLRVPALPSRGGDHLSVPFYQRSASVKAVRHADGKRLAVAGFRIVPRRRIDIDQSVPGQSQKAVLVPDRAAGEHGSVLVRKKNVSHLLPVKHIRTAGMSPRHSVPLDSIWIVLIIQLIDSIMKHQTVRVIDPTVRRGKMNVWKKTLF